jgi:hypothetical protein
MEVRAGAAPALWLCLVAFAFSARARAEAPAQEGGGRAVMLDNAACAVLPAEALRELVALELAPRPLLAPDQTGAAEAAISAQLVCSGTQAALRVEDTRRGEQQELTLDLAETMPSARTRLVALAISELVASLELEAQASPAQPKPAAKSPAAPHARGSAAVEGRGHAWLAAGLSRAGEPAMLGWCLHGGTLWYIAKLPLALQADVFGTRAEQTLGAGQVTAWTLSGSLSLALGLRRPWIETALGAGFRVGYASLAGRPTAEAPATAPGSVHAAWWGPVLSGSLLVPVYRRLGIRAALDLAYIAKPVRGLDATGATAYALERFALLASLGLGLGF